jgi:hypothetical protein
MIPVLCNMCKTRGVIAAVVLATPIMMAQCQIIEMAATSPDKPGNEAMSLAPLANKRVQNRNKVTGKFH